MDRGRDGQYADRTANSRPHHQGALESSSAVEDKAFRPAGIFSATSVSG